MFDELLNFLAMLFYIRNWDQMRHSLLRESHEID
jgi:hypothetical protein